MSDPDWEDVPAVRAWLEKRYSIALRRNGSPFFQYLKEEFSKGNKMKGRERHLCGDELVRWVNETSGDNSFAYRMGTKKTTYYPEYLYVESGASSQGTCEDDHRSEPEAAKGIKDQLSKSLDAHREDHTIDKQSQVHRTPTTRPPKKEITRNPKSAKAETSQSLTHKKEPKSAKRKAQASTSKSKATQNPSPTSKSSPKARRRQDITPSPRALQPRDGNKRTKTGNRDSCLLSKFIRRGNIQNSST